MIGVTGASGEVGGRVARLLASEEIPLRIVGRDPARAPKLDWTEVSVPADYRDGEAMRRALDGVGTLFMVSAGEARDRVELHRSAVEAAAAAGVERIVYLSFFGAAPDATFTFGRDHFHTEQAIRESGVRFTFLRDNLYLDYVPLLAAPDGTIRGPAADGRVAAVARDDVAAVAAVVLTGEGHDGVGYELTGPEAFTLAAAAEELSRATGRMVEYVAETLDEARASRAPTGAPDWEIEGWVTSYAAVAAGELAGVSDSVERLTGHAPVGLIDFLRGHPESYGHLVG